VTLVKDGDTKGKVVGLGGKAGHGIRHKITTCGCGSFSPCGATMLNLKYRSNEGGGDWSPRKRRVLQGGSEKGQMRFGGREKQDAGGNRGEPKSGGEFI